MAQARVRLRKRIVFDASVKKILQGRGKVPGQQIKDDLRQKVTLAKPGRADISKPTPPGVTPMSGDDRLATVWGLSTGAAGPEDVRKELIDKSVLITEVILDGTTPPPAPVDPDSDDYNTQLQTQKGFTPLELEAISVDMKLAVVDYAESMQNWNNARFSAATFGSATDAMRAIRAPWVARPDIPTPKEFTGKDVNVVIIDEGMNRNYMTSAFPNSEFAGGFVDRVPTRPDPGAFNSGKGAVHSWHAHMILRNILRIAPEARIFDAPLLPSRVSNVDAFTDDVQLLYEGIETYRDLSEYKDQPWVLVNAWAVADSIQEYDARITANRRYTVGELHHANVLLQDMSDRFDIVFAAGNNGSFQPSPGAGLYNRGPERSICGANSLSGVLTVGAANVNGTWIGASSEGPGQEALKYNLDHLDKPDVVAPSWFSEDQDTHQRSTGSSAACGVAAGMVAALRTTMRSQTPQELFDLIRAEARQIDGTGHSPRTGCGMIQFPELAAGYPAV